MDAISCRLRVHVCVFCNVINQNAARSEAGAHNPVGGNLEFTVVLYNYDPMNKQYFVAFRGAANGSPLNGLIGGFAVNPSPSTPESPWELAIGLTPETAVQGAARVVQEVMVALKAGQTVMEPWGVIQMGSPPGSTGAGGGSDR